jgi:hypothetical protein
MLGAEGCSLELLIQVILFPCRKGKIEEEKSGGDGDGMED